MALQLSVYLVAENRLLHDALLRLLQKRACLAVAGHGDSPEIAARELVASPYQVLLIDSLPILYAMHLPELLGAQPHLAAPKVVLFGMNEDRDMFLEAVRAGVSAYLLKDASAADVIAAIRGVSQGEAVCPPRLCLHLFQYVVQHPTPSKAPAHLDSKFNLTPRQQELVELLVQKLTNKEIAKRLNLSEFTVKNHVRRIIRQLEATNRYEAVELILANGYPDSD